MTLAFILNIEREDVVFEVFPPWSAFDERVDMFQHMSDTVIKVSYAVGIAVPTRNIIIASFAERTVEGGQIVLADVRVIAPTAQLVSVVQSNREFDICTAMRRQTTAPDRLSWKLGGYDLPRSRASTINRSMAASWVSSNWPT